MAITTYSELQTAVANWLDRSDLTSRIPEFIALFEAKMNRRLRVRQQLVSTSLTPSSGSVALPADYLEWKRVTWTGSPRRELEYVEPSYLQQAYPDQPSDTPRFFTIEGANLVIIPRSTTSLEFLYYEKIDAVSGSVNWLFSTHPDAYMFGTLVEASAYMNNIEAGVAWNSRLEGVIAEIERLSSMSRGQMQIRAYGSTP